MGGCVLHDVTKDECRAKGLYCFDPDPENYTECIALNNAFNLGVVSGVKKCTIAVREQLEKYKGESNDKSNHQEN